MNVVKRFIVMIDFKEILKLNECRGFYSGVFCFRKSI